MKTPADRDTVTKAHSVTVHAPDTTVWLWLVQMGQGRAGFYTYTWVQNILGAHIGNLDHIEPGYQGLRTGDRIWLTPRTYRGRPGQFWTVRVIDAGHAMVLTQSPPDNPHRRTWTLTLEPGGAGQVKLVSRHTAYRSRPHVGGRLRLLLWSAAASIMEHGVLHGIKRRAEAAVSGRAPDQAVDNRCSLCPDGWIRTIDLGSRRVVHMHDWCDGCGWRLCTASQGQCTWVNSGQ